jgi:hypothetical protein
VIDGEGTHAPLNESFKHYMGVGDVRKRGKGFSVRQECVRFGVWSPL